MVAWNDPEVETCRMALVVNIDRLEQAVNVLIAILQDQVTLAKDLREALMSDDNEGGA